MCATRELFDKDVHVLPLRRPRAGSSKPGRATCTRAPPNRTQRWPGDTAHARDDGGAAALGLHGSSDTVLVAAEQHEVQQRIPSGSRDIRMPAQVVASVECRRRTAPLEATLNQVVQRRRHA